MGRKELSKAYKKLKNIIAVSYKSNELINKAIRDFLEAAYTYEFEVVPNDHDDKVKNFFNSEAAKNKVSDDCRRKMDYLNELWKSPLHNTNPLELIVQSNIYPRLEGCAIDYLRDIKKILTDIYNKNITNNNKNKFNAEKCEKFMVFCKKQISIFARRGNANDEFENIVLYMRAFFDAARDYENNNPSISVKESKIDDEKAIDCCVMRAGQFSGFSNSTWKNMEDLQIFIGAVAGQLTPKYAVTVKLFAQISSAIQAISSRDIKNENPPKLDDKEVRLAKDNDDVKENCNDKEAKKTTKNDDACLSTVESLSSPLSVDPAVPLSYSPSNSRQFDEHTYKIVEHDKKLDGNQDKSAAVIEGLEDVSLDWSKDRPLSDNLSVHGAPKASSQFFSFSIIKKPTPYITAQGEITVKTEDSTAKNDAVSFSFLPRLEDL